MSLADSLHVDAGVTVADVATKNTVSGSALTAAAVGRLYGYLRLAQPVSEHDEIIARDAYMTGFCTGARWMTSIHGQLSALSNPKVRDALIVLAELLTMEDV